MHIDSTHTLREQFQREDTEQFRQFYSHSVDRIKGEIYNQRVEVGWSDTNETVQDKEKQNQQGISNVFNSLNGLQLLKLYAEPQFLQELIANKQKYPLQTDQIVWRITYLLGEVLLLIQNNLLQHGALQSSVLLSVKQIKQAAYRLVEFELSQKGQRDIQQLQAIKEKIVQCFYYGQIEEQAKIRVYNCLIGVWRNPLNIQLNMEVSKQTQQTSIQTDPITIMQTPRPFKMPLMHPSKLPTVATSSVFTTKHLISSFAASQVKSKEFAMPRNMSFHNQIQRTPTPMYASNRPSNYDINQEQPETSSVQRVEEKCRAEVRRTIDYNRFRMHVPPTITSNPLQININLPQISSNPLPIKSSQIINQVAPIKQQKPTLSSQGQMQISHIKKPFKRKINFMSCLPKKHQISTEMISNNDFLVKNEQPETEVYANQDYNELIKLNTSSLFQHNHNNIKEQSQSQSKQQTKSIRQKWTAQQQSILTSTFIQRGNLLYCSKKLHQTFQTQNPKYSLAGVKHRINLIVHRVHQKFCSLNSKNENIQKLKSNWDFIRKKSSMSARRKIYINIVGIYVAMLNMSEGKAKTISGKVLEINAICQYENNNANGQKIVLESEGGHQHQQSEK